MKKIGLIVNPIAGMGGRVGLKGTDGPEVLAKARARGAKPLAPERAKKALAALSSLNESFQIWTCPGDMGESILKETELEFEVVPLNFSGKETGPEDTVNAARKLEEKGVDIIVFAGGDGTARDVFRAIDGSIPVIGIPAGVKIHSGVFANTPSDAGQLLLNFLRGEIEDLIEAEVMDIDEEAFRQGRVSAKLFGYLKIPADNRFMQGLKTGVQEEGQEAVLDGIAERIVEDMEKETFYFIGPGTTTRRVMEKLDLKYTLLGVDVVQNGKLLDLDVGEKELLEYHKQGKCKIIVTPIGGQGFVFGRGNQQFSPGVLQNLEKDDILIIATKNKLQSIPDGQLKIDTGDQETDEKFSGYYPVRIGYQEEKVFSLGSSSQD